MFSPDVVFAERRRAHPLQRIQIVGGKLLMDDIMAPKTNQVVLMRTLRDWSIPYCYSPDLVGVAVAFRNEQAP